MPQTYSKTKHQVNDIEHSRSRIKTPSKNLYFLEMKQKRLKKQLENLDKHREMIISQLEKVTREIREKAKFYCNF